MSSCYLEKKKKKEEAICMSNVVNIFHMISVAFFYPKYIMFERTLLYSMPHTEVLKNFLLTHQLLILSTHSHVKAQSPEWSLRLLSKAGSPRGQQHRCATFIIYISLGFFFSPPFHIILWGTELHQHKPWRRGKRSAALRQHPGILLTSAEHLNRVKTEPTVHTRTGHESSAVVFVLFVCLWRASLPF